MGEIIKFKVPKVSERHKGKSLCREGFHKWVIVTERKFDVKAGRLVTLFRCARCGKIKARAL